MLERNSLNDQRALRLAWGEFLEGLPWDHFVTLTFRQASGPDYARRAFGQWIRRLEREARTRLLWFVGFEDGRLLGRLHLHALVGNTDGLAESTLEEAWTPGFARIQRFQPRLGAAHYVTKYITKDMLDYDVSPALARRLSTRENQWALPGIIHRPTRARTK